MRLLNEFSVYVRKLKNAKVDLKKGSIHLYQVNG